MKTNNNLSYNILIKSNKERIMTPLNPISTISISQATITTNPRRRPLTITIPSLEQNPAPKRQRIITPIASVSPEPAKKAETKSVKFAKCLQIHTFSEPEMESPQNPLPFELSIPSLRHYVYLPPVKCDKNNKDLYSTIGRKGNKEAVATMIANGVKPPYGIAASTSNIIANIDSYLSVRQQYINHGFDIKAPDVRQALFTSANRAEN